MFACHACHRHVRASESACPFCGASMRQGAAPLRELVGVLIVGASLLGTSACTSEGDDTPAPETSGMTESSGGTTSATQTETGMDTGTDTGTETSTTNTTDDSTNTSGGFYGAAEDFNELIDCDPYALDCPEGDKCVPTKLGAAHHCVPVLGELALGEACVRDPEDATDDCGEDSYCGDAGVCSFIVPDGDTQLH